MCIYNRESLITAGKSGMSHPKRCIIELFDKDSEKVSLNHNEAETSVHF